MTRELRALAAVALIFGAGFLGYRLLFGQGLADSFRIVTVAGDVQHLRAGGKAEAAVEGSALKQGDRIVSGDGASAVLGLGNDTRISVDATTTVEVVGVTEEGVQLELEGGRVRATVRPGGGRVGVRGGGKRLDADDADFTVVRDGAGNFAVSSERGAVRVGGVDGVAELREGDDLVVPNGGAPVRAPASEALLLHVAWPTSPRTRERSIEVTGSTQPGASVRIAGGARVVGALADAAGNFSVSVPLSEGKNALTVSARSVLGREATIGGAELERDTLAPSVGVSLDF
jgi:hypothetical protein